jgi:hypothetical protein
MVVETINDDIIALNMLIDRLIVYELIKDLSNLCAKSLMGVSSIRLFLKCF